MILYEKEKEEQTMEDYEELLEKEIKDIESRSDDSTTLKNDDDLEEKLYNAFKRALYDYDMEKEKSRIEAENELNELRSSEPTPSPSPTPPPTIVHVENFPKNQDVNIIDWHTLTDALPQIESYNNDAVQFGTSTDSRLYTVSTSEPVSSATGQSAVYLMEIRNIVLIFCCLWFVVYIVSMLKRVSKRFGKGE